MRDIVIFVDAPDVGRTAPYHRAARSLGLSPVVVSGYSSDRHEVPAPDVFLASMDVASILSAIDRIGRERIAGVFAAGAAHVECAARVAAALDRPHADPDAIALCNDKHRLRAFLDGKGLNTVAYRHVETMEDAARAVESIGGAVVVKPLSSTGSNGVRICRAPEEAIAHARRLLKQGKGSVLVEEFIDAPQYSVECFDGIPLNIKMLLFSEGPFAIIAGVDTPAFLERRHFDETKIYAESIVKEVGLVDGPAFVELRDSGAEKYVIEINPRPSGNGPIETYVATGIDISELCLKFVCGIRYDRESIVNRPVRKFGATRHIVRSGSSVLRIKGVEEARKIPGVTTVQVSDLHFYRRGPATCALDRIAAIHGEADTKEAAAACADSAIKKLNVVYDRFPLDVIKYHARKIRILWNRVFGKHQ